MNVNLHLEGDSPLGFFEYGGSGRWMIGWDKGGIRLVMVFKGTGLQTLEKTRGTNRHNTGLSHKDSLIYV